MTPWMDRAIDGWAATRTGGTLLDVEGAMLREFGQAKDAHDDMATMTTTHEDDTRMTMT